MLYIVSILRLGESPSLPCPLDDDSKARMFACLQVSTWAGGVHGCLLGDWVTGARGGSLGGEGTGEGHMQPFS